MTIYNKANGMQVEVWGKAIIERVDAVYQLLTSAGVPATEATGAAWIQVYSEVGWEE